MSLTKSSTILGIDPGTNLLGFGIVRVDAAGKPHYVDTGVLDLRRVDDLYEKLHIIFDKVCALCAQVIFKLGRAQGAAMAAALTRGAKVYEYAPRKAKQAICGNGAASKEQVALMVEKTLGIDIDPKHLDATDALAIAMCHFYQMTSPLVGKGSGGSWEKFIAANPDRVK